MQQMPYAYSDQVSFWAGYEIFKVREKFCIDLPLTNQSRRGVDFAMFQKIVKKKNLIELLISQQSDKALLISICIIFS